MKINYQSIFACIAYKAVTFVISYIIFINVRKTIQSHDTLFIFTYKNSADLMEIIFLKQKSFFGCCIKYQKRFC